MRIPLVHWTIIHIYWIYMDIDICAVTEFSELFCFIQNFFWKIVFHPLPSGIISQHLFDSVDWKFNRLLRTFMWIKSKIKNSKTKWMNISFAFSRHFNKAITCTGHPPPCKNEKWQKTAKKRKT